MRHQPAPTPGSGPFAVPGWRHCPSQLPEPGSWKLLQPPRPQESASEDSAVLPAPVSVAVGAGAAQRGQISADGGRGAVRMSPGRHGPLVSQTPPAGVWTRGAPGLHVPLLTERVCVTSGGRGARLEDGGSGGAEGPQLAPGHPEGGRAPPPVRLRVPGVPASSGLRKVPGLHVHARAMKVGPSGFRAPGRPPPALHLEQEG